MKQSFKTVYFPGHPATQSTQRHIRLAFGDNDRPVFDHIEHLSSEEIRGLLGLQEYNQLATHAQDNALSINRACISLLHKKLFPGLNQVSEATALDTDPLIATFRGGSGDPLHSWFPLLEGFSPRFVKAIMNKYAPKATRVFDPFAGTGSTPLTAASVGLTGLYCELNPLLQFVADAKYRVLQLAIKPRQDLVEKLRELAFRLPFQIGAQKQDEFLRKSYGEAFGDSHFFEDDTFEDILRLRTLADELSARTPLLGQLFLVAILASLVNASLMIRRGDLRYKNENELPHSTTAIGTEVTQKIREIASDVEKLEQIFGQAILVAEDAQSLGLLPTLEIDCVITSPPYLNGTNYFRNTKIELWFLRALTTPDDLTAWRHRSVTAGINDVTKAKCDKPYPSEVREVVEKIYQVAYDNRIPLMVSSYFRELEQLFSTLRTHLKKGAVVAIDIGDSRYSGVHVETDKLLTSIASGYGLMNMANHTLRIRRSHDGGLLKETLLVFEYAGMPHKIAPMSPLLPNISRQRWDEFKHSLPHQSPPFSKRNWGHPLHSLCSYEGKMKPSIAHFLVQAFVPDTGRVLDPFAGVGTIPFEACLQGKETYGFEISPAAYVISRAKVARPNRSAIQHIVQSLNTYLSNGLATSRELDAVKEIDYNHSLVDFYHADTLREIVLARRFFSVSQDFSVEESFVMACLLHILHGNRPYALSRRSHPVTPFAPQGPTQYKPLIKHLWDKLDRSLNVDYPSEFRDGKIYFQDATSWWPKEVDSLDAVITSPPFFDSTRFYLANWIRLWFSGWEKADFETQPLKFLDIKQKQTMWVYESVLRQARERLKRGGVVVLHLGKSSKCDMATQLAEVAKPWFKVVDLFEESVSHCESHGITDKGNVYTHQYLVIA